MPLDLLLYGSYHCKNNPLYISGHTTSSQESSRHSVREYAQMPLTHRRNNITSMKCCRLLQMDKSAVAEHALCLDHRIDFNNSSVLDRSDVLYNRRVMSTFRLPVIQNFYSDFLFTAYLTQLFIVFLHCLMKTHKQVSKRCNNNIVSTTGGVTD